MYRITHKSGIVSGILVFSVLGYSKALPPSLQQVEILSQKINEKLNQSINCRLMDLFSGRRGDEAGTSRSSIWNWIYYFIRQCPPTPRPGQHRPDIITFNDNFIARSGANNPKSDWLTILLTVGAVAIMIGSIITICLLYERCKHLCSRRKQSVKSRARRAAWTVHRISEDGQEKDNVIFAGFRNCREGDGDWEEFGRSGWTECDGKEDWAGVAEIRNHNDTNTSDDDKADSSDVEGYQMQVLTASTNENQDCSERDTEFTGISKSERDVCEVNQGMKDDIPSDVPANATSGGEISGETNYGYMFVNPGGVTTSDEDKSG